MAEWYFRCNVPLPASDLFLLSYCCCSNFCQKTFAQDASTPADTDVDTEVLFYISAAHTYVGHEGLAFWNSTSAFPSLTSFAQDSLAAPASQAYVHYEA